ncbi:restriction endonuclease subunit S [Vibrio sp. MMH1-50]|uniref:restriction endonuclease subunit S n=1 Tax=Vibrio sp. MMH1-50 TaxID=2917764 RepID=UPI001EF31403|nr:restriction endonuclease subunit S [Vibrio sp. MMH1-50]MCG7513532.1 restriction endonuclease subunit S [Vibrio sp. MMH1-50]
MAAIFEKVVAEFNLDRSDWQIVKFGDVAIQQKQTVDRENTKLTRYVKGEHMYSEDIHLREWGELKDEYLGPAFTRKFEEGDILYGSRRTYLRKVAVAPFEGITSNTTFVIKANEAIIDKRLLPFIMLSEGFAQHSIKNSKGSVNPYVNWKDLSDYEFLLPPKNKQGQIVELLVEQDELLQKSLNLKSYADICFTVQKNNNVILGMGGEAEFCPKLKVEKSKGWKTYTISDLLKEGFLIEVQDGNHGDIHPKSSDYVESGIPFVMANALKNGSIDLENSKKLDKCLTDKLRIGFAHSSDVLLSHKGTIGEVAIVPEELNYPYLMLTPQVTYYRVNKEKLSSQYLYYVFTSNYFQSQLASVSSQSTRAYIGITAQKKLKVAIPNDKCIQDEIVDSLVISRENLRNTENNISALKLLQKSIINQVF